MLEVIQPSSSQLHLPSRHHRPSRLHLRPRRTTLLAMNTHIHMTHFQHKSWWSTSLILVSSHHVSVRCWRTERLCTWPTVHEDVLVSMVAHLHAHSSLIISLQQSSRRPLLVQDKLAVAGCGRCAVGSCVGLVVHRAKDRKSGVLDCGTYTVSTSTKHPSSTSSSNKHRQTLSTILNLLERPQCSRSMNIMVWFWLEGMKACWLGWSWSGLILVSGVLVLVLVLMLFGGLHSRF
jgi:hypothetical protein